MARTDDEIRELASDLGEKLIVEIGRLAREMGLLLPYDISPVVIGLSLATLSLGSVYGASIPAMIDQFKACADTVDRALIGKREGKN